MSEIKRLIEKGEGKTVEFKETLPEGNHIAKTVVAFSNMAGGRIIIGVEDKTGKVIGINDDEAIDFPDRISNIVFERCHPFILPEIYVDHVADTKVLVVEVFPGALKPYYLKKKGKREGTYIRVGATNKPADMEMLMELERQKRNISFDEELEYEVGEGSLNIEQLKKDFQEYTGKDMTFNDLLNLKIIKKEHDRIHPTIGGLLLAAKAQYLEYARIKCARFKGTTIDEFIDQKEFSGPLYRQVEDAMKFAQVYIAKSGKVEGLRRIDRYEVPLEVIREALVNAVVHRDYSISGADIKFAIFDDRIEVISPGALPRSLEIEDIIAGRSEIRNKVVARFFKEIDFIEQWGFGIRKMIRMLKKSGLEEPRFRESGLFFKITIFKKRSTKNDTKGTTTKTTTTTTTKTTTKAPESFNKNDFSSEETTTKTTTKIPGRLIQLIKENPSISSMELAEQLHMTKYGIRYHLKKFTKKGILKRIGSSKSGYWIVNTKALINNN